MDCLDIESTPSPAIDQSTPADSHMTTPIFSNVIGVIAIPYTYHTHAESNCSHYTIIG